MRTSSAKAWISAFGAVLLLFSVLGIMGIHTKYFFNPLTFRNNHVLYLPWKWYTKPLTMQIFTLEPGLNKRVDVRDAKPITYVLSELEKGSKAQAIPATNFPNRPMNPVYAIYITAGNHPVLQKAYLYPKDQMAEIDTQHGDVGETEYISLTPSLLDYIQKELGH